MAWMDTQGDALHHGSTLENMTVGEQSGCNTGGGGPNPDPGIGTQGSLWDSLPSVAQLLGISTADAASASNVPSPYQFWSPCFMASPDHINTFSLLTSIPNTRWKGCVEARAEPFDVNDTPPSTNKPDTLFVPWFWPDEPDNAKLIADGNALRSTNDYLPDRQDLRLAAAPVFDYQYAELGYGLLYKYNNTSGNIDETAPDTLGPNKACPDPIVPLTSSTGDVTSAIDNLSFWNGSGTNVAEGLAWGWRVLSPSEPFSEGAPYGKTNKVIVLMTDGVNNVDPWPLSPLLSQYSAYGYLQQWVQSRIAPKTYVGFKQHADARLAEVCKNAKAEDIKIYTVAFGVTDAATLGTLRDCATAPPYAYSAQSSADLIAAFQQVARSLTALRLAK